MAIEYASSPLAHPGTQTRMGASAGRSAKNAGRTCSLRAWNTSGSRKKDVTEIRQSW